MFVKILISIQSTFLGIVQIVPTVALGYKILFFLNFFRALEHWMGVFSSAFNFFSF